MLARRFFAMLRLTPFICTLSIEPNWSFVKSLAPPDAFTTSSSVILPIRPVPFTFSIFTPSLFARFLTAGVARTSSASGSLPTTPNDFFSWEGTSPSPTSNFSTIVSRASPTFAISPSNFLIFWTNPFFGEGTSTTALSVSTSRMV